MKEKIGIVGLGKLGLPMLCLFIKKEFDAIGYDCNHSYIKDLQNKKINTTEPKVLDIIEGDQYWSSRVTSDLHTLITHSTTIFVILPTPQEIDSEFFSTSYIKNFIGDLINLGYEKDVTLVITSTLNPGDCELFLRLLPSNYKLVYSPEFIALGSVIDNLSNPCICLIGSDNISDSIRVQSIYQLLYSSEPKYHLLSTLEVEIAKLAINSYITTKISFANTIGSYIYKLTKDREKASRTLNAIGDDYRINNNYLRFGGGFGGPCFPRDNKCLSYHLNNSGISDVIPRSSDILNENMVSYFSNIINSFEVNTIVYVGITYKENTSVIEESFILKVHHAISKNDVKYYFMDDNINTLDVNGIKKIDSFDHMDVNETLIIINHSSDYIINYIKNSKFNYFII